MHEPDEPIRDTGYLQQQHDHSGDRISDKNVQWNLAPDFPFRRPLPIVIPPRQEERTEINTSVQDAPLLDEDETTHLFRGRLNEARSNMESVLRGDADVSEAAKQKLTLDMSHSKIERVPENVIDLIRGEVDRLSLSTNRIWYIPLRFSECSHLRYLDIRSNIFREIPRGVYRLPSLEILDVGRNKIRRISKEIRQLTSLRVLSAVHNRIDDFPVEICGLDKLEILKVDHNPLRFRLRKIVEAAEADVAYTEFTDAERQRAITIEIKKQLRVLHQPLIPMDAGSGGNESQVQMEASIPAESVLSGRISLLPSNGGESSSPKELCVDENDVENAGLLQFQVQGSFIHDAVASPATIPPPRNPSRAAPFPPNTSDLRTQSIFADSALGSSIKTAEAPKLTAHEDDVQSTFTDNQDLSIPADLRDDLVTVFADSLYQKFCTSLHDKKMHTTDLTNAVADILPDILKDFSMQLAPAAQSEVQKKAILLVRRYRRDLARRFTSHMEDFITDQNEADSDLETNTSSQPMTVKEKMEMWDIKDRGAVEEQIIPEEVIFPEAQQVSAARTFLFDSMQFKWLLGRLQAAVSTTMRRDSVLQQISKTVTSCLSRTATQQTPPTVQNAVFHVAWDPLRFIAEQEYSTSQGTIIDKVITISGSICDAQALTCAQYMEQTWPTTGVDLLQAMSSAITNGNHANRQSQLPSGVELSINVHYLRLVVSARGPVSLLAEIAAQLAWLCAACRAGPHEAQMAYCKPQLAVVEGVKATFRIDASVTTIESHDIPAYPNGTCWHGLFRNPVIVTGVPIAIREHNEKGLEIPLNMMVGLGCAPYATSFDDVALIKGHSSMFLPTGRDDNSVNWHFVYNIDGSRIPYWAAASAAHNLVKTERLAVCDLAQSRHFLGWTTSASSRAGTESMAYTKIRWSGSEHVGKGCAFEKVTISGGMYLSGGASFSRGNKDTPLHLSFSDIYERQIRSAKGAYVVFYDVEDRRAWLLDGASALLHLTRAQLESLLIDEDCQDNLKNFEHARPENGPKAILLALKSDKNRNLPIFTRTKTSIEQTSSLNGTDSKKEIRKMTTSWCFEDLVQETWYILEQIMDHQSKLLATPGVGLRFTDREKLEGFDFKDIVEHETVLKPRVAVLKASGRGWVDFLRNIGAICLLGRGFGDLIVPRRDSNLLCHPWARMPKGQDYLAAQVLTLQSICDKNGDETSNPLRLAGDIHWHQPDKLFEPCECKPQVSGWTCDPVQVLLPPSLGPKNKPNPFSQPNGAVIFGRSRRLLFKWPNIGIPSAQSDGGTASQDEMELCDSGLGSSLATSTSRGNTEESGFHSASRGRVPSTIRISLSDHFQDNSVDTQMSAGNNVGIIARSATQEGSRPKTRRTYSPGSDATRYELAPESSSARDIPTFTGLRAPVSLYATPHLVARPSQEHQSSSSSKWKRLVTRRRRVEDRSLLVSERSRPDRG